MVLSDLEPSQIGEIISFKGSNGFQIRLAEMGFRSQQKIRMISKMAFNGPVQVQIRNSIISLRYDDALQIRIELDG